ncbi:DNA replication and repair protein RecF [Candidatus Dependentiae bacterium]|nr:DNA replication and repair protein RecF [Candidatus Dependentiae bacterium]
MRSLQIRQFRCFEQFTIAVTSPLLLIEGNNGSGKTSLLEAVHYLCYLKSFRTHLPRELLRHGTEASFVSATFIAGELNLEHQISAGAAGLERSAKLDGTPVKHHREIIDHFRVITLTEDDLWLIKSGPEARRAFIDQYVFLHNPDFLTIARRLRQTVQQRNAALQQPLLHAAMMDVWTHQLWELSTQVGQARTALLQQLVIDVNALFAQYFAPDAKEEPLRIAIQYQPKRWVMDFEQFIQQSSQLLLDEQRLGRSLFGAHLDDFSIIFCDQNSRSFASRGQQKLVVLLLKIAQLQHLITSRGASIFLLDDFMTDFDEQKVSQLLPLLLSLQGQLIFTTPLTQSILKERLIANGAQIIRM